MLDLGRHRLKDIPEPVHLYQLWPTGWTATSRRCAASAG